MKNYVILIFVLATIHFLTSCSAPLSKESYIKDFEEFDQLVSSEFENYDSVTWVRTDEKYHKFSNDWYNKFKEDMTLNEKMKINSIKMKYKGYKTYSKFNALYEQYTQDDIESIKMDIEYYIDNGMDEDIEKILESAEQAGDSVFKVIEKILDDLDYEIQ